MRNVLFLVCLSAATTLPVVAQTPPHSAPHCEMMQRGDHALGFSHETTTHHFRLFNNGGEIAVEANNSKDSADIAEIRGHLAHIAQMFAGGNFGVPMFIHDTMPPGAASMAQGKDEIRYEYFETDRGARIRVTAATPQATDAVHAFLLFQIADHQTGDSPKIEDETQKK